MKKVVLFARVSTVNHNWTMRKAKKLGYESMAHYIDDLLTSKRKKEAQKTK